MAVIAALYVQSDGVYAGRAGVELWDVARDARKYAGPWPVVAHPPCRLWGPFSSINFGRWGGEHNRPGNDDGCFAAALQSVCVWGGVLEHPAGTRAWERYGISAPITIGWSLDGAGPGWVCEVWQSAYGHRARKRTWLYYVSPTGVRPPALDWSRPPGTHQIGFPDQRGKARNKPTISGLAASATPPEFAELLLGLAQCSYRKYLAEEETT